MFEKPRVVKKLEVNGKEVSIVTKKGWFGNKELHLIDHKGKAITKLKYGTSKNIGFIDTAGLRFKARLPKNIRGKGIFSKMIDHIVKDLESQGVERIEVELKPDIGSEETIKALFAKRGFEKERDLMMIPSAQGALEMSFETPVKSGEQWVWKKK